MIVLITFVDKVYPEVMSAIRRVFPECRIFASSGNPEVLSIPDVERLIYHENFNGLPLERIKHYYFNILNKFIPILSDIPDDEPVLVLHQNVVIDDTCSLLLDGLNEYVFISSPIRTTVLYPFMKDKSDRCIAYLKSNFVKCHSYTPKDEELAGKTTVEYVEEQLTKEGLKCKYDNAVKVKELDSTWI